MEKPKWRGYLLPIAVVMMVGNCPLMSTHLAAYSFSLPIFIPNDLAEDYNHRGIAKFRLSDKQGAILDYDFPEGTLRERVIRIDSQDAFTYYNRGVAKFELGDKQGAILDFDRVIEIDPQDAEAYSNRGAVKLALGNKQGAIADLTKGAQLFRQQGKMADYKKIIELIRRAI
jgi:tetratricopeptide (TPR) repeat protein